MSALAEPRRWPVLRQVLGQRRSRLALAVLGLQVGVAIGADLLASDRLLVGALHGRAAGSPASAARDSAWRLLPLVAWGPHEQDRGHTPLEAPSRRHWLGTDTARRDVLARLIHGTRVALAVGLGSMAVATLLATLLGLLAAYHGGWVDLAIGRIMEAVLCVPTLLLILAVLAAVERFTPAGLALLLGVLSWTGMGRLVRTEALRLRHSDLWVAARGLGTPGWRMVLRHLLPGATGPLLVLVPFGIASTITVEATLGFLGLGLPDEAVSWGRLLEGALGHFHCWWLVLAPGAVLLATVWAWNCLGVTLEEALDPRRRWRCSEKI